MFRTAATRLNLQRLAVTNSRRFASNAVAPKGSGFIPSNALAAWYNVFGKSSAMYASWLIMLIVAGEYATGKITDSLWEMNNKGKTFTSVDWSKFDQFGEAEEEDDDDEDDE